MTPDSRNARALAAGQAAWDNASPAEDEAFLETSEGQNWLAGVAGDLIDGLDLKIGGTMRVEDYMLAEKLAGMALAAHESDQDGALGQILHAVAGGNIDRAKRALYMLISKTDIQNEAEALCAPFADEWVKANQEDDYDN